MNLLKSLLALLIVVGSQVTHAEFRNPRRLLLGGANGDAPTAARLFKILSYVKEVDKEGDFESDEVDYTLEGLRCSPAGCEVRAKFGGSFQASAGSLKTIYAFLRDDAKLGASFYIGSLYCEKTRPGAEHAFCDIELTDAR